VSVLLIDAGNTRIKWARLARGRLGAQRAAAHAGWSATELGRRIFGSMRGVEQVLVASVAGARIDRVIAALARQRYGVAAEFVKTRRCTAGVTTLYQEPWRLGVDRFVAIIGAHHLMGDRPVCVVDIGTALTLDLVDSQGRHRGGAIVPGPDLMMASLLKDTSGIQRRAAGALAAGRSLFARNTRSAIRQGARYTAAAAIDRALEEGRRLLGETPTLVLTGGAAPTLRRLIRRRHRWVPDLVLRGLAVVYHSK